MRDYELVTIINPEIPDEGLQAVQDRLGQWITAGKGEVTNVNVWGRRRMAYSIGGHREGNYLVTQFRIDPPATLELERSLKLSDDVIRYLLVRMGE